MFLGSNTIKVSHALYTSHGKCPGGIIVRYWNHFIWLLLTWKITGCTLRSSLTAHLFSLLVRGKSHYPAQRAHFCCMWPQSYPFSHNPELGTVGKDGNVDWLVNWVYILWFISHFFPIVHYNAGSTAPTTLSPAGPSHNPLHIHLWTKPQDT